MHAATEEGTKDISVYQPRHQQIGNSIAAQNEETSTRSRRPATIYGMLRDYAQQDQLVDDKRKWIEEETGWAEKTLNQIHLL